MSRRRRVVAACPPPWPAFGPLSVCARAVWFVAYLWNDYKPPAYWLKYYEGPQPPAMPGAHPDPTMQDPGPWVWWNWMDAAGNWQQGEFVAPGAPMPNYTG